MRGSGAFSILTFLSLARDRRPVNQLYGDYEPFLISLNGRIYYLPSQAFKVFIRWGEYER
jgi:hypothetical protein